MARHLTSILFVVSVALMLSKDQHAYAYPSSTNLDTRRNFSDDRNYGNLKIGENDEETSNTRKSRDMKPPCPSPIDITPCQCFAARDTFGQMAGTITCQTGITATQTKFLLSKVRDGLNIQTVSLNLPKGTTQLNSVPGIFTSRYPTAHIVITNPAGAISTIA